uniref:Ubiquitin-like domain-containing protein n=1 Tax=Moschus moschiferus TaxID=68415 RepID=A0A8C6FLA9_MOSMO
MDVFLMIRRHKTTIFTDAKESSTVFELKRIVEGILKRPPDEQRLYKMRHLRPYASSPSPARLSCRM